MYIYIYIYRVVLYYITLFALSLYRRAPEGDPKFRAPGTAYVDTQ